MKNNLQELDNFIQEKESYYKSRKDLTKYEKYFMNQQKYLIDNLDIEFLEFDKIGKAKYSTRIEKRLNSTFRYKDKIKWYKLRFILEYLVYLEDKKIL